jgi:sugar/nucleoside kinase (ribokinase family)
LVAKKLGGSVAVVSKVGSNFPDVYLQQLVNEGVDVSGILKVNGEQTTSFELAYNSNLSSRVLRLRSRGSPIVVADLPPVLHAKAIHVAPIAGEISYEVVKHLRNCSECLSIDPQGMMRRFDACGNVMSSGEVDKRLLGLIDIYKSSLDEVTILTGNSDLESAMHGVHALGPKIVIVTKGAEGSVLSAQGKIFHVPVCPSRKVVDPTGAGDVFIGAFLTEYVHRGQDPFWCACVGSAAASLVVEAVGTTFFGSIHEIYDRTCKIFEKRTTL